MRAALLAFFLAVPAFLSAQDSPTLDALIRAEDARAPTAADVAVLRGGLRAPSPTLRAAAARGIGRLERAALIPDLAAALDDSAPSVRASAAIALIHASAHGGGEPAHAAARAHLASERDAAVVAALGEALGWIAQGDSARARATADTLVALSRAHETDGAPDALLGVMRGLFGLARQPVARRVLGWETVRRLTELAGYRAAADTSRERSAAQVRELALLALVGAQAASDSVLLRALDDADRWVRVVVMRAAAAAPDTTTAALLVRRGLADDAPEVRLLAVTVYARRFGMLKQCAPLLAAAADRAVAVQIQAVDALGAGCADAAPAAALLDSLAATLPAERAGDAARDAGAWHLPAHALVSLAALSAARARSRIPAFAVSRTFFVRDYAARAAAKALDTTALRRLAGDAHANVRTSAVAGLSAVLGHAADDVYLAALRAGDSQLLQTAAQALAKSRDRRAVPALLAALDRVTAARSETSRDARVALLDRVRELGDSAVVRRLRPYLADFDTLVAARAADMIGAWTGRRPTPRPVLLPRPATPTARELAALDSARVTLEMADGGSIVVRLFPYDAPTAAARFARLARAGRFDGLTIHRVVAARLVQGGSPGANEYAGWGAYQRDELGLPNVRGAVGVSTRGRDTGDGQFYIDIGDLFELDHNYTVFGHVVEGMDVVDRMQEGALIRRATVR